MTRYVYVGLIKNLRPNDIFVFGSNPEGRHGAGAAKLAYEKYGAKRGQGSGLQGQSYGLITKNLKAGYHDKKTNITYEKAGPKSVTEIQIIDNIKELYKFAKNNPNLNFLIAYTATGNNLNGYTNNEMASMFNKAGDIPLNIIFEEKFYLKVIN